MSAEKIDEDKISAAKKLVEALEAGDNNTVDHLIDEMNACREASLFQELGKLTRQFHEALNGFRCDERLASLAEEDMPDAKERLSYVITRTEEAANRTLNAVENAMPVCDAIVNESTGLWKDWERFQQRDLTAQEFRQLSKNLAVFLLSTSTNVSNIRSELNDVLMAQDFQDITGQIIRRVITLVDEAERNLVDLIRLSSSRYVDKGSVSKTTNVVDTTETSLSPSDNVNHSTPLEGPQIPGLESANIVKNQDDVDDLLSSLGF